MLTRDQLIYDILDYTGQDIVDGLIGEVVTVPEILDENPGEFSVALRKEVENLLFNYSKMMNKEETYELYLRNYPEQDSGNHVLEVKELLENLKHAAPVKEELPPPLFTESEVEDEMPPIVSDDPWDSVDKKDIKALIDFRAKYSKHPKYLEAGRLIRELEKAHRLPHGKEWMKERVNAVVADEQGDVIQEAFEKGQITPEELIELFKEDNNFINRNSVGKLLDSGVITTSDLREAKIKEDFLNVIDGAHVGLIQNKVDTKGWENPTSVPEGRQEIYFWGIPASGKTCALGAILSAATSGEVSDSLNPLPGTNGYAYLNQLMGTFQPGRISELPSGTNADFVAEMSFNLIDKKKKSHQITLIDMPGEMLDTMRRKDENDEKNISEESNKGYDSMINLLVRNRTRNSKIHFFVVEYGGHDRVFRGMKQADLLNAALTHIAHQNVFDNTDAVYILMTKADNAFKEKGEINDILKKYLLKYYKGFCNRLKTVSENNGIKQVGFIPFTIGEVCFKNLCRFNSSRANTIVETFIDDTVAKRTGILGSWIDFFRS